MKRDNINYLLVGSFVLSMGVALVVLLFAVTGRSGPTDTYYVVYDNVAGFGGLSIASRGRALIGGTERFLYRADAAPRRTHRWGRVAECFESHGA